MVVTRPAGMADSIAGRSRLISAARLLADRLQVEDICCALRSELRLRDSNAIEAVVRRQEANHRIKNQLQIVASALLLQARSEVAIGDGRAQLLLAAQRVHAIAEIHKLLQDTDVPDMSDPEPYLRSLVANISLATTAAGTRPVQIDVEPGLRMIAPRLLSLGLVTTEFLTNALKHGVGAIRVEVRAAGRHARLSVASEILSDANPTPRMGGLGLSLVRSLSIATGHRRLGERDLEFSAIL
ncbi:histidine kinase dimerization/phosphoacceptor domain -containing protein [Falsiroseomonas tokyonensis]|uniref:histidine kinase n=1 Tax=Falsiroseomonas tokyonensis TaxID=430521 RepID=A0ABV7C3G7_9PROT|nr:sensor histidine kinase [Falsiroseomonas tokyonensis]MBU8541437.1 sensor histidine kinase [Falsiroseomonas tokyonensis]